MQTVKITFPPVTHCPFCERDFCVRTLVHSYMEEAREFGVWIVEENYYKCTHCQAHWQPVPFLDDQFQHAMEHEAPALIEF